MNCKVCNDGMMGYFDGTLNDIEIAQLKVHLKGCKSCNDEFEAYGEVIASLEEEDGIEPPVNFEACVMEKINTLEVERKRKSDGLLVFIYGVSTVLLAVLGVFFLAGLKHISFLEVIGYMGQSFSSFSQTTVTLQSAARIMYDLVTGFTEGVYQSISLMAETYYNTFLLLLAMFVVAQKMYLDFVSQNNRSGK